MQNRKTMIVLFVLTFWGFAFCSAGLAQDDKKFIPGEDSGFYYTIKKGDTLWGLSQKFYNSQWDWPGLWEMNDDIKNPHWITPGKIIQIFLKDPPSLESKSATVQKIEEKEEVAIPFKEEPSFSFSKMDRIGFIKKKAQTSLGTIFKEQENNLMMSTNDIIYIKPSGEGTLVPNRIYHIFTTDTVKQKVMGKSFKGIKHLIKAQVKILDHKGTYVKGIITNTYSAVGKGDMIMEYYKRNAILTVEDTPDPINAGIICSENNTIMINDYQISFINMGNATVKPGQIYSIFRENKAKNHTVWPSKKEASIEIENLKTGKLIVLHTEDIASTVMILSSKYAIHPNDRVH